MMTEHSESFAELLRQFRESRSLSKADLARALEVSPGYVYQLETGRSTAPQIERVRKLSETLRLTPGEEGALLEAAAAERTGRQEADVLRRTGPQAVVKEGAAPAAGKRAAGDTSLTISDCVAYRVHSNSMAPRLLEGQMALCSQTRQPDTGDIVMVRLHDGRRMFRNYYPQGGSKILLTANHDVPNHPPETIDESDIRDCMVVVGLWFG